MDVQFDVSVEGETWEKLPQNPTAVIVGNQAVFNARLGLPFPPTGGINRNQFANSRRAILHNLDMAVQELSEAWDHLEGGWKHHKKTPRVPDQNEVLLELADVVLFLANVIGFAGSDVNAPPGSMYDARTTFVVPPDPILALAGFEELIKNYSHAEGAHGAPWEGKTAAVINGLRASVVTLSESLRNAGLPDESTPVEHMTRVLDSVSAGVMNQINVCVYTAMTVPSLYELGKGARDACSEVFFNVICHKQRVNHRRQDKGY